MEIINRTVLGNSREILSESNQRDILLPAYLALDDLRAGRLGADHFVTLNESNCTTWQLGRQLAIHRGSVETGELAMAVKRQAEAAADALAEIGSRFSSIGNFTPRADELDAVRGSIDTYRQLLATMPSGCVFRAIDDAGEMVGGALAKNIKESA